MDSNFWEILKYGWGVLSLHNWYLHKRADECRKDQAEFIRRKEFDDTITSLRDKIEHGQSQLTTRFDDNRREITDRFDRLFAHLLEKK